MEITDQLGRAHRIAPEPRIASLVPSVTELLFALGLGPRLVARTSYCTRPAAAARVVEVGGPRTVDLPRLLAQRPTHALLEVEENPRELADALEREGVEAVVLHPRGPQDNPALYRLLGGLFGRCAEAEALCAQFERALARLQAASCAWPERRVLYLIWKDPWMTVSPESYSGRTLALAKLRVVGPKSERAYPVVSIDEPLLAGVELVLFSTEPYPFTRADLDQFRQQHPSAPRLLLIDGEAVCWFGSRAIRGLAELEALASRLG